MLHRQAGQARKLADQMQLIRRRRVYLVVIDAEGAEHGTAPVLERNGPAGPDTGLLGEFGMRCPIGMTADVVDDDRLTEGRRGPA